MPTIRDNLLTALVDRLDSALDLWNVQLRDVSNAGALPMAVVYQVAEDKQLAGNDAYDCTLAVGIDITAAVEDADEVTDAGNPFRYLDRLVGQVETVIHAPDAWGLEPDFTDVRIDGHDVAEPEEEDPAVVSALLRVTFTYRHFIRDPGA